ncbi:MAG: hypothetical protein RMY64_19475 [Nostoc sp. DedQUE08]|uniref:hypothetical protein n=1 Tax=Nostoc sp. DedQUE08 TaxID=3075393 RepID=UPI002AD2C996|nr:hypothetical protein [Nostoc sp. DedQUE08]MDZ8067773.1 hypothetical protein [Nostoc sp. DedQUE08]
MQSALDCAGKCDCCQNLQSQINALKQQIANIKTVDELSLKNSIKASLQPDIATAAAAAGVVISNKLQPQVNSAIEQSKQALERLFKVEKTADNGLAQALKTAQDRGADRAEIARIAQQAYQAEKTANNATNAAGTSTKIANNAFDTAGNAQKKAALLEKQSADAFRRLNQVEDIAASAARESSLSKGLANQAVTKSGQAISESAKATNAVINAATEATGLRQIVNGVGSRIDGLGRAIGVLESKTATAVANAAKAIGISSEALAATGRLAGRVLELFQVIGTIFTIIEQLQTLVILGDRIDAVENGVVALGNDLSRVLGKLLGLQNRIGNNETTIAQVKNIALDAKGIGEAANLKAGAAQVTSARAQGIAESALGNAKQAQLTADGAVRNAATANENATTAYKQGIKAEGIGQQAAKLGGQALQKAGEALALATTVIATVQLVKGLQGLRGPKGDKGDRGLPGLPGRNGTNGTNGQNGITTVVQVQLPGIPGRDGRNGINGRNGFPGRDGKDGKDMGQAEVFELKAFIAAQHQQTQGVLGSAIAGIKASVNTGFATVVSASSAVVNGANLALLNVINNKLGQQVTGGISGLVTAVAENTYIEKALAVLTFATTVHNALMLSSNLGQTLFMIIDQVTAFILPKGLDGTPISISNVLGKAVHEVIVSTVGEATAAQIQQKWDQANRIYQAALNIHNQVLGLGGILTAGLEVIGGNVGKIGNALRKGGVLLENAYSYMNPQPNLKGKFFNQMNLVGENLQAIALVTAIPIALAAAKDGVDSSVADLKREISQIDPTDAQGHPLHNANGTVIHYKPGLDVPDPAVVKAEGDQAKADSTNFLQLVLDDIFDGGD